MRQLAYERQIHPVGTALSFCCKSLSPRPPILSAETLLGTNFSMIHGKLDVLRDVTACQMWLQEDPCPREVFVFGTTQEFELKWRPRMPDGLHRPPRAEPRVHLECDQWMLSLHISVTCIPRFLRGLPACIQLYSTACNSTVHFVGQPIKMTNACQMLTMSQTLGILHD